MVIDPVEPGRRRKRLPKWVIGIMLVPIVLCAIGFMFILFILWIIPSSGGPEVQIVVTSRSSHSIQLDKVRFGEKITHFSKTFRPYPERRSIGDYYLTYFIKARKGSEPVEIWYREVETGKDRHASFVAENRQRYVCLFFIIIEDAGPQLQECIKSEIYDFDY